MTIVKVAVVLPSRANQVVKKAWRFESHEIDLYTQSNTAGTVVSRSTEEGSMTGAELR